MLKSVTKAKQNGETYADGTAAQRYFRGLGLVGNGKGEFYLKNGHGDVVQIVNSSFEVKDSYAYEYDAFGNNINKRNGDTNPFRYCSEYYDIETDSVYLRARYYNPSLGRFMSEDPVKDGTNWYGYCGGNPVMCTDPSGLKAYLNELNDEQRSKVVSDLQQLTDYELSLDFDDDGNCFLSMSKELKSGQKSKYDVGNSLLSAIVDDSMVFNIKNGDRFKERKENGQITIFYNFNDSENVDGNLRSVRNKQGEVVEKKRPTYIALAHELIHGYHDMRNISKSIDSKKYSVKSYGTEYTGQVVYKDYMASDEELYTVGIGQYSGYRITENSIRAEHGLEERVIY